MFGKEKIKLLERRIEVLEKSVNRLTGEDHILVFEKLVDSDVVCSGIYYRSERLPLREVIFLMLEKLGVELVYKQTTVETREMKTVLEEVKEN